MYSQLKSSNIKKTIAVVETNSGYENKIICTIRINTYLVGWLIDSVNCLNEHYSVCAEVQLTNNVGFSPYAVAIHRRVFASYLLRTRSKFMPVCAVSAQLMIHANQEI